MTDRNTEQDVELYDDENEIMEAQAHDPKNAEAQSVASVDKASDAGKTAKKRPGDKSNSEPMPKTKAGMVNAMYNKLSGMKKEQLAAAYSKMMEETESPAEVSETSYNFKEDLDALVTSEATLSEEFKEKTAVIFEAAIKSKISEEVERLEEQYAEELAEEVARTKEDLVEKVDSYLNYVVENWMQENKLAIQTGLRTEIAESFMNNLKNLFVESYIEVPESKVDLVDGLAEQVEELEESLNKVTQKNIDMMEELETLQRKDIIRESSKDLAQTQVDKLEKLAESVEFDDAESFAEKVATLKESYFSKEKVESVISEETENDDETSADVNDTMAQYLSAIRRSNK
jgi:hypothetical protein